MTMSVRHAPHPHHRRFRFQPSFLTVSRIQNLQISDLWREREKKCCWLRWLKEGAAWRIFVGVISLSAGLVFLLWAEVSLRTCTSFLLPTFHLSFLFSFRILHGWSERLETFLIPGRKICGSEGCKMADIELGGTFHCNLSYFNGESDRTIATDQGWSTFRSMSTLSWAIARKSTFEALTTLQWVLRKLLVLR